MTKEREGKKGLSEHEAASTTAGVLQLPDTRVQYEILGEGHPLVLIQGSGLLDLRVWDEQFAAFAKHFQVIRYNARGVGKSEVVAEKALSTYFPQQDLYQLLKFLKIKKTYILGLSRTGGVIAIDFTLEHPEMVDALVLISSGLNGYKSLEDAITNDLPERLERFAPAANAWKDGDISRAVDVFMEDASAPLNEYPLARQKARAIMTENLPLLFLSPPPAPVMQLDPPNQRQQLSEIHVPTLIIVGERDSDDIPAIATILETEIAGARKKVVPDTRHLINMEQPETFNQMVIDFLGEKINR